MVRVGWSRESHHLRLYIGPPKDQFWATVSTGGEDLQAVYPNVMLPIEDDSPHHHYRTNSRWTTTLTLHPYDQDRAQLEPNLVSSTANMATRMARPQHKRDLQENHVDASRAPSWLRMTALTLRSTPVSHTRTPL
jgi:hypothetical protein